MREIPSLQTLCLRSVGGKACSGEDTFAATRTEHNEDDDDDDDGQHSRANNASANILSSASKLLRSFPEARVPIARIPAIGDGSARRKQANDVDLSHPWVAVLLRKRPPSPPPSDPVNKENDDSEATPPMSKPILDKDGVQLLYTEYNTPSLDVLQSYIDSLVELSRFDDARLGLHFFQEWKANVILKDPVWAAKYDTVTDTEDAATTPSTNTRPSKRRRASKTNSSTAPKKNTAATTTTLNLNPKGLTDTAHPPPLGSLSLYNTVLQDETIQAMVESNMTYHLAVLDWTGVQTLTDDFLQEIITRAPHLKRLSIKNCRRLTQRSLECLGEYATQLTALDMGGTYQFHPQHVIEMIAALPQLTELHASGLLWTDALLQDVCSLRSWTALSLGFLLPAHVSSNGLKQALMSQSSTLQSLALPFCEHIVDAALLGVLGRHLPHVVCIDVRGNGGLHSLTGWYDGRATIQPMVGPQPLFVLGRYSGISKSNIEDTKRIHPLQALDLTVSLGSDGVGEGIRRYEEY